MKELLDKLDDKSTIPKRKPVLIMSFADCPELYHALDQYRRNQGWTWKRMTLVGNANTIAKQNDNPDLVVLIADYLSGKR